ncbi:MAG: peptide chain release factor N(5)-glutamine methyltransferase, partial [Rhizobiales bacterium]|nr:peptide chain release factor N(5)-glutamine methyltransferase [Hyphomicrobiales bacterium]
MTIREAIERAANRLKGAGVENARQDAWLLLAHVRGEDRLTLLAHATDDLGDGDRKSFQQLVARRQAREPLAQIVGKKEFWSLDFLVTTDVLCPRADSETVIDAVLADLSRRCETRRWPGRMLDLGTGSGCLLLALLSECQAARGIGVDVSMAALSVARTNGERLGLQDRARWLCADWGTALAAESVDLIVANPPYIADADAGSLAPEIRRFEPGAALFAGAEGLDAYQTLAPDLHRLL